MVAIIVGTLIYYQNCSCTLPTAPKVPGLTLHCNIFFLLQVIDVLAASIEYGLEGLTKVPGVYIYIYIYICVCVCVCVYILYSCVNQWYW